jgi:ATP-dependent Lon protease
LDQAAPDQDRLDLAASGALDPSAPGVVGALSDSGDDALPNIPSELPVLPLRNVVVFPGTVVPLTIGREKARRLIDAVLAGDRLVAIFTQRREETEDPGINDIYRVGTVAQVLKLLRMPDGSNSLLVHGVLRVGLEQFVATEPYWRAVVNRHDDRSERSIELDALVYNARATAEQVIRLSPNVPDEAIQILNSIERPGALADFLAANLSLGIVQKQELLETFDVIERLRKVNATLQNQLEVLQLAQKLQEDVRQQVDKTQREYFLQEQMKAIQRELGEGDTRSSELEDLRRRLEATTLPEHVRKEAQRELGRLERIPQISPENGVVRDYLEWLIELPWETVTEDSLDLDRAQQVLDEDHFGLDKIKRRIIEYLAVHKLNPTGRSPILCFAGPPGVGKTSLGQSIARALGRRFIRIALGGVRDEADIRGHRRTYIGSIPGRIIQEIRKAGSCNPVIMLDELDKLGSDFRGDPASALLEVLDPEQNHSFTDHYLGLPFDLSRVLFIGTANYMEPVAPALKDRMEVIDLPGYTTAEKLQIAQRYLVPRQFERNGLSAHNIAFDDEAIRTIIERYTREAGVRNLERAIGTVLRGLAAKVAKDLSPPATITPPMLSEYLGQPRFEPEVALRVGLPGVATGLAYTPAGGEIIFVEATLMPGRGTFTLTGQMGDVMRESAQAALSLIRTRSQSWDVMRQNLQEVDLHVHVPAGAVPKDGPSAGTAMLTALYTLLAGRPADPTVAMTGEITLRGLVLPVGGIKEKVLAAHRAGIRAVILPERNRPDLEDVPADVRKSLEVVLVSDAEEVLARAVPGFQKAPGRQPKRAGPVVEATPTGRRKVARRTHAASPQAAAPGSEYSERKA